MRVPRMDCRAIWQSAPDLIRREVENRMIKVWCEKMSKFRYWITYLVRRFVCRTDTADEDALRKWYQLTHDDWADIMVRIKR